MSGNQNVGRWGYMQLLECCFFSCTFFVFLLDEGRRKFKTHTFLRRISCVAVRIIGCCRTVWENCLDSGPWVENLIPGWPLKHSGGPRSQYLILRRLVAYKWVSNRIFLFQGSIFRTYVSFNVTQSHIQDVMCQLPVICFKLLLRWMGPPWHSSELCLLEYT